VWKLLLFVFNEHIGEYFNVIILLFVYYNQNKRQLFYTADD